MRLIIGSRCGPRSAHPPNARFLSQKQATQQFHLPHRRVATHYEPELIPTAYSKDEKPKNESALLSHSSTTHTTSSVSPVKIPSTPDSVQNHNPAPVSNDLVSFSSDAFTTVLRKKNKSKKTFSLSPNSYYKTQSHKSKKESSTSKSHRKSPFLQLNTPPIRDHVKQPSHSRQSSNSQ